VEKEQGCQMISLGSPLPSAIPNGYTMSIKPEIDAQIAILKTKMIGESPENSPFSAIPTRDGPVEYIQN
jgi:hypothetical protein